MFSTTLSRVGEVGLDIFLVSKMEVWKSLGLERLKDLDWIRKFSLSVPLNR